MKLRLIFAFFPLVFAVPSLAQVDPCTSPQPADPMTLDDYILTLTTTVSDKFNAANKSNATAATDTKNELASRANGDGNTNNRLDLLKKAFLALDLGQVDEKDGNLVFNFNPDTLNSLTIGQFSPRITVHKAMIFMPLEKKIETLPESVQQSRKDTLTKGIGDLDDVEASIRWTLAFGTPRTGLQEVATDIFDSVSNNNQKVRDQLNHDVAQGAQDITNALGSPSKPIMIATVCASPATKTILDNLTKEIQTTGTQSLTELKKALDGTLFFKLADLIDGQPRFSANGSFRRRNNAAGPDERSFEFRFDMGSVSYWGLKRFAASRQSGTINPAIVDQYFKDKSGSAPNFSISVDYVKTSDFSILLPVDATEFQQPSSRKISAVATGGLYFGGGRAHRLELKANYDDITDDPTRQNRFVSTLSWVEKLNPTLTQALGGSDLTVTLVYANKPEFRGEVNHDLGLRAGLKWSIGGTTTK